LGVRTYFLRKPWQTSSSRYHRRLLHWYVSLTVVVRTLLFCSRECRVVLDLLRVPYPWLVLDGTEDFVDGKSQRGEMLFHSEARRGFRERIGNVFFLKVGCP